MCKPPPSAQLVIIKCLEDFGQVFPSGVSSYIVLCFYIEEGGTYRRRGSHLVDAMRLNLRHPTGEAS